MLWGWFENEVHVGKNGVKHWRKQVASIRVGSCLASFRGWNSEEVMYLSSTNNLVAVVG